MTETRDYKVSLRYSRGSEFVATFPDSEGLPPLVFDESSPLGEGSGPNAAAVLAAAIGDCLAARFTFCLRTVRLERCEQLFEDFGIVTESVRRGIPVNVKVVEPRPVKEIV